MPEFCQAFEFARGVGAPGHLQLVPCEGTVASRRVCRLSDGSERTFEMCTRHADLLWMMGHVALEGRRPPNPQGDGPARPAPPDESRESPRGRGSCQPLPGPARFVQFADRLRAR